MSHSGNHAWPFIQEKSCSVLLARRQSSTKMSQMTRMIWPRFFLIGRGTIWCSQPNCVIWNLILYFPKYTYHREKLEFFITLLVSVQLATIFLHSLLEKAEKTLMSYYDKKIWGFSCLSFLCGRRIKDSISFRLYLLVRLYRLSWHFINKLVDSVIIRNKIWKSSRSYGNHDFHKRQSKIFEIFLYLTTLRFFK